MISDFSYCLRFFTLFCLDKKFNPYFPFHNVVRSGVMEMTPSEKDLLLLGIICSSVNNSANTMKSRKKPGQQDVRRHARIRWFYYQHFRICRATFLYIMVMSKTKLTAVKKWYLKHGLLPRKKLSGNLKIKNINKD